MKTTKMKSAVLAVLTVLSMSFSAYAGKKPIDVKKSTITWVGKKITGSQHTGTISLKSGELALAAGKVIGGTFVINMNSISTTDLSGDKKNSLDGHLKSDDFFDVKKYPEAKLVITSGKNNVVKGKITIKGHTEEITFTLLRKGKSFTTHLTIDRAKFGVRYGSKSFFNNLKDKAINDEFELDINLTF